ncbi:MAG TPA: SEC-C metal-binding domain-containing protein [Xanthobacteraceae bacterium]|nr:SEC-C metal-binding domain-containing protein [Xanthobacteraceae bacterium]
MAKIGRNQPCKCGSGKKYKRCCGFSRESRHVFVRDAGSL